MTRAMERESNILRFPNPTYLPNWSVRIKWDALEMTLSSWRDI